MSRGGEFAPLCVEQYSRRMLGSRWTLPLVVATAFAVVPACAEDDERPATIDPGTLGVGGGTVGGGAGGTGGGPSEGGTILPTDGGSTDLEATVVVVTGDEFDLVTDFGGTANVVAEAAAGGVVVGTYDGAAGIPAELSGVLAFPGTWVGAQQTTGSQDVMNGFWPVDTSTEAKVQVPVVLRSVVDQIFSLLLAANLADPQRAQVILQFTDAAGATLAGVGVSAPGTAVAAFRAGGTWSDNVTETDSSGLVAVLNVDALEFPGSVQDLSFTVDGVERAVPVRTASDTVTIAAVSVQ